MFWNKDCNLKRKCFNSSYSRSGIRNSCKCGFKFVWLPANKCPNQ